ncbi:MAG: division/cell wall cluster transcriptional repressor MraZ [Bacteroidia bacterium]|nr:division/cell wall cluster transcriptional repressor MraZ [Bacteroidia bacterium]
MSMFLGEFECKLDAKGRIILPSVLRKQLPQEAAERLVVNRGFEKCLVIYPKNEWDLITAELAKQNSYNARTREFIRYFTRGATELVMDNAGRILVPKPLQEYAALKTEIILSSQLNKIEIWSKESYDRLLSNEPEDFARLAEEVMGNKDKDRRQND